MNIRVLLPAAIFGAIFAVLWITGPVSCADRSSPAKPSADVEREVEERRSHLDYSIEQWTRPSAGTAMDDIDSCIIRFGRSASIEEMGPR